MLQTGPNIKQPAPGQSRQALARRDRVTWWLPLFFLSLAWHGEVAMPPIKHEGPVMLSRNARNPAGFRVTRPAVALPAPGSTDRVG